MNNIIKLTIDQANRGYFSNLYYVLKQLKNDNLLDYYKAKLNYLLLMAYNHRSFVAITILVKNKESLNLDYILEIAMDINDMTTIAFIIENFYNNPYVDFDRLFKQMIQKKNLVITELLIEYHIIPQKLINKSFILAKKSRWSDGLELLIAHVTDIKKLTKLPGRKFNQEGYKQLGKITVSEPLGYKNKINPKQRFN